MIQKTLSSIKGFARRIGFTSWLQPCDELEKQVAALTTALNNRERRIKDLEDQLAFAKQNFEDLDKTLAHEASARQTAETKAEELQARIFRAQDHLQKFHDILGNELLATSEWRR